MAGKEEQQMPDQEMIIMELVVAGGNARSTAIEALRCAKADDFEQAEKKLKEADASLLKAHHVQTDMIQREINGDKTPIDLLTVHAQDHIMNAMTVLELVKEMIEILKVRS